MYKKYIAAFLLLFIVALSLVGPTQAKKSPKHHVTPNVTNCTHICTSSEEWPSGKNNGIGGTAVVDNPTLTDSSAYWNEVYTDITSDGLTLIHVGIEKVGTARLGFYCNGDTGGVLYYFWSYTVSGVTHQNCGSVPAADIGHATRFRMGFFVTNGPGMWFEIIGQNSTGFCNPACFIKGLATLYEGPVDMDQAILDDINGHEVKGVDFALNQYDDNGTWKYATTNAVAHEDLPPADFWNILPSMSSNGGQNFKCAYDSPVEACTIGG